jgi:RNase adaptor protein for sRNA GlmZ degradation
MLDKKLARKLNPLVNNKEIWEALLEHLNNLKNLDLQALVVATSELEMYRLQGKMRSVVQLEQLKEQVKEALNRKE